MRFTYIILFLSVLSLSICAAAVPCSGENLKEKILYLPDFEIISNQSLIFLEKRNPESTVTSQPGERIVPLDMIQEVLKKGASHALRGHPAEARLPGGSRYKRQYRYSLGKYMSGQFRESADSLIGMLREYPRSPLNSDIQYLLAESLLQDGKWHEAKKYFIAANEFEPEGNFTPYALYSLIWMARNEGKHKEEVKYSREFIERFPLVDVASSVFLWLGETLVRLQEYGDAAMVYQQFLDLYNDNADRGTARFQLAECLFHLKKYEQSFAGYREYLKQFYDGPLSDDALFGIAWSQIHLGNYSDAASNFSSIVVNFPESPIAEEALYLAGKAFMEIDLLDEADNKFREIEENFPEGRFVERSVLNRGLILSSRGIYQEAARHFSRAAEVSRSSRYRTLAEFMEGDSYCNAGKYREALTVFRRIIASGTEPDLVSRALMKSGWCCYLDSDYAGAAAYLRHLILNYPNILFSDEASYWLAECYYESGNYSLALYLYKELAKSAGNRSDDAQYGVALSCFRQEKWLEAASAFNELIDRFPESAFIPEALFRHGESLYNGRMFTGALKVFQEYGEKYPGSDKLDTVIFRMGNLYLELGDFANAAGSFELIEKEYPSSKYLMEARYFKALSLLRQEKYQSALEAFKLVSLDYPGSRRGKEAELKSADAYYEMGRYKEALDYYLNIRAKLESTDSDIAAAAQYGVLRSFAGMKRPEDFRRETTYFRKHFPESSMVPKTYYLEAEFESAAGNENGSRRAYIELVEHFPDHELADDAYLNITESLMDEGLYQEALIELRRAASLYPEGDAAPRIQFNIGKACMELGDHKAAGEAFEIVLKNYPGCAIYPDALYYSALCFLERGDVRRAGSEFAEFIGGFPDHRFFPGACLRLAEIKTESGKYDESLALLQKAVSQSKDDVAPQAQFRIGRIYQLKEENDRAIIEYLKVPYIYPDFTLLGIEAQIAAAYIYIQTGNKEGARNILQVIKDHPDSADYQRKIKDLWESVGDR